jgi:hypothetical protein
MYMQEGDVAIKPLSARPGLLLSVAVAAVAVVIVGLLPQPYMTAATNSFASAIGRPVLHAVAQAR